MKDDFSIKKINSTHLREIALIHVASFEKSLLTHLGFDIVKKYYEWQLVSSDKVYPYGVFLGQKLVGYIFGGSFRMALGGFLLQNKKNIFYSMLKRPWIVVNPDFIKKILIGMKVFTRFTIVKKNKKKTFLNKRRKNFGILAIATNPEFRGMGIGTRLMVSSEKIAREKSFNAIRLSVSPKNKSAIKFYKSLGYEKILSSENNLWNGNMEKKIEDLIV